MKGISRFLAGTPAGFSRRRAPTPRNFDAAGGKRRSRPCSPRAKHQRRVRLIRRPKRTSKNPHEPGCSVIRGWGGGFRAIDIGRKRGPARHFGNADGDADDRTTTASDDWGICSGHCDGGTNYIAQWQVRESSVANHQSTMSYC